MPATNKRVHSDVDLPLAYYSKNRPEEITMEIIKPDQLWLLCDVFSSEECDELIEKTENVGYGNSPAMHSGNYRKNQRMTVNHKALANELFMRIQDACLEEVWHPNKHVVWRLKGVNHRFRFCKYDEGGFTAEHTDDCFQQTPTIRSFFTCMLYLNETNGGGTNFIKRCHRKDSEKDNISVEKSVKPQTGKILLFSHNLRHEDAKLLSGHKYVMHTEVMYERVPPINDDV
jgi:hypothetical protein